MKKTGSIIFIFLFCYSEPLFAQTKFQKTFHTGNWSSARSIVQTADSGFVFRGTVSEAAGLTKTDKNGVVEWPRTYRYNILTSDGCFSVAKTNDKGYVLAGYEGYGSNFWVIKTDSTGVHQWSHTYGGNYDDVAFEIKQTFDGGYIVAGTKGSYGMGNANLCILKTDAGGNVQWCKEYGITGEDESGRSVIQTADSGYIVCGSILLPGIRDRYFCGQNKQQRGCIMVKNFLCTGG